MAGDYYYKANIRRTEPPHPHGRTCTPTTPWGPKADRYDYVCMIVPLVFVVSVRSERKFDEGRRATGGLLQISTREGNIREARTGRRGKLANPLKQQCCAWFSITLFNIPPQNNTRWGQQARYKDGTTTVLVFEHRPCPSLPLPKKSGFHSFHRSAQIADRYLSTSGKTETSTVQDRDGHSPLWTRGAPADEDTHQKHIRTLVQPEWCGLSFSTYLRTPMVPSGRR